MPSPTTKEMYCKVYVTVDSVTTCDSSDSDGEVHDPPQKKKYTWHVKELLPVSWGTTFCVF